MPTNTDDGTRNFVIDPKALIVDYAANILARFGGNIDRLIDAADDDEEEVSSIYRQPSWRFYTNLGPSGNYHPPQYRAEYRPFNPMVFIQQSARTETCMLGRKHAAQRAMF